MNLVTIGLLLIFIGIITLIVGIILLALSEKGEVKGGFVGFIGPIPIGFGTDKGIMVILLVIAIVIMLAVMFLSGR
ncbi:MAG: hypothetical protein A7316_01950 [Candidatus Altiarchaeales archaeon WOR_SM1_86-2]|nr:MAG: hypothetical protein A7315_14820 [Candidatus Altiarchaeales archaeon WOR_SM1_79]ODS37307.1 MAG: hypothetical protein A7316_01950 [Candidatus Altiarchaeales archaeon WOR_SM1_86-2]